MKKQTWKFLSVSLLFASLALTSCGGSSQSASEAASSDSPSSLTSSISNYITVTFKNWDGTLLSTLSVLKGSKAVYTGDEPVKKGDDQYHYVFTGWDVSLENLTEDTTATAVFEQVTNIYAVTFKNWDGTVLDTQQVAYGSKAVYSKDAPVKSVSDGLEYSFTGWDGDIDQEIKGEITFTAVFKASMTFSLDDRGTYYTLASATSFVASEIVIPSSYNGLPVKAIGFGAFSNCDWNIVKKITLPSTIETINAYAFYGFKLEALSLPSAVKEIADTAFTSCPNLKEINVDANNATYSSSDGVLFNKDQTTLLTYPAAKADETYQIPDTVTSIEKSSFQGCSLKEIKLPSGLTSIGEMAFSEAGLTKIDVPSSVTSIGENAFASCSNMTEAKVGATLDSLPSFVFSNCSKLTTATLTGSIKALGTSCFLNCSLLTSVTLPDTLTEIGKNAFSKCAALASISLPSSLTKIGVTAFNACVALTEIIIPKAVTSIASNAFKSTTAIKVYCEAEALPSTWATDWASSNVTPYYYSETEKTGCWHYVSSVPTLW